MRKYKRYYILPYNRDMEAFKKVSEILKKREFEAEFKEDGITYESKLNFMNFDEFVGSVRYLVGDELMERICIMTKSE